MNGLKVIENKYCYAAWTAEPTGNEIKYDSVKKEFLQPRDVELYHLCGVYHTAGVPVEIEELSYNGKEQPCVELTKQLSDSVCKGIKEGKAILVAGGYCNYAPAVAGGIQKALGAEKKIGVIWIDAHADNQIAEEHGKLRLVAVPVSTMTGQTLEEYRKKVCGLEEPIDGENILISDGRIIEADEERNLQRAGSIRLNWEEFENQAYWEETVNTLAEKVDAIYLSIDGDILLEKYVPAYDVPVLGGHEIDIVMKNIAAVMKTEKVYAASVFCIDFDHYERGGEYTYLSGMKLIASILHNWKPEHSSF